MFPESVHRIRARTLKIFPELAHAGLGDPGHRVCPYSVVLIDLVLISTVSRRYDVRLYPIKIWLCNCAESVQRVTVEMQTVLSVEGSQ